MTGAARSIYPGGAVSHRDDHDPLVLVGDVYSTSVWRYQEICVTLAGNIASRPYRLLHLARHAVNSSQAVIGAEDEDAGLVRSDLNLVAPGIVAQPTPSQPYCKSAERSWRSHVRSA
jgi:hypothetical protein